MDGFKKFLTNSGACKGPGPNGIFCPIDRMKGRNRGKDLKIYRGVIRQRSRREMLKIIELERERG